MKNNILNNKNVFILGGIYGIIIIIFTNIIYNSIPLPTILNDEFGYWSTGAYLNGQDWTGLTAYCQYYSYGYGVILAVLIAIFREPLVIYKAALVLNSVMLVFSMFLGYGILNKLKIDLSENMKLSVAFVTILFSSNIFNAQIAWAECFLLLLFTLLTYCILALEQKPTYYKVITISFVTVYLYIIHQRALGLILTVVFIILLMTLFKIINWKYLLVFVVTLVLLLIGHGIIKDYFQNNLWVTTDEFIKSGNDYSGQVGKLQTLFTVSGFGYFILGILGRVAYIGISTLGIFYYGFFILIRKCFEMFQALFTKTKNRINSVFPLYLLLSFATTISIAIIFILIPGRIDNIIYGRYFEWILYPVLLYSLAKIIEKKNAFKSIFIYILLTFTTSLVAFSVMNVLNLGSFVGSCSIGLISYYWVNRSYGFIIFAALLTCLLACYVYKLLQGNQWKIFLGLGILLFYWGSVGINAVNIELGVNVERKESVVNLTDMVLKENLDYEIKYLNENIFDTLTLISNVQFLNSNRKIEFVNMAGMEKLDGDIILLVSAESENIDLMNEQYKLVYHDKQLAAFNLNGN